MIVAEILFTRLYQLNYSYITMTQVTK